ncbi:sodium:solute symporter family protein [Neobacillus novalis]|uniref:Sodium:solute symporter family protein n=1 Tax=Neobacillus novalis TaxID=220687 RepID=A0AA95MNX5_9BACI|nr:sodium:solute symporter family protein [Neobacillus novalis]WHY84138.1 sodium:solute symporter family protein [Neobacillus novalis]
MEAYKIWAIVSLLIYFAALLVISLRKNKNETKEDFFLAGRRFPHWALALTFVASWFGGNSALISVDQAYEQGISAWWIIGSPSVLAVLALMIFAKAIRRVGSMSQSGIMEKRYNKLSGTLLSILIVWYMITWGASQMVAISNFFSSIFGISYLLTLFICVAICIVYATIGGFRAVVFTEMLQFGLLLAGLLITLGAALYYSNGFEAIKAAAVVKEKTEYFNFMANFSKNFLFLFSFGLAWVIDASAWQRISATKSPAEARKTSFATLIYFIPIYFFVVFTGVAAGAIFTELPKGGVISSLVKDYMHPFLGAIVLVGIGAAIMSTITTTMNGGSLYMTELYRKHFNKNATEKQLVRFGMLATVIISAFGMFIAVRIPDSLWVLWMSSDILAAGLFVPMIFGFFWRRGTSVGALSSTIFGCGFVLYNFFIDLGFKLPSFWPGDARRILIGVAIGFSAYFIGSFLSKPEYEKADKFFEETQLIKKYKNKDKSDDHMINL